MNSDHLAFEIVIKKRKNAKN